MTVPRPGSSREQTDSDDAGPRERGPVGYDELRRTADAIHDHGPIGQLETASDHPHA
jgi:hypothetical protein